MNSYAYLLALPPALALAAAWFASRAIRRGAAEIDRKRAEIARDPRRTPA